MRKTILVVVLWALCLAAGALITAQYDECRQHGFSVRYCVLNSLR